MNRSIELHTVIIIVLAKQMELGAVIKMRRAIVTIQSALMGQLVLACFTNVSQTQTTNVVVVAKPLQKQEKQDA